MNVVNFNERACERYRRYFDSYLDNELLVETNQDVLQHLNSCTKCTRILEGRARMKQLVKNAVTAQSAPPELVTAACVPSREMIREIRAETTRGGVEPSLAI